MSDKPGFYDGDPEMGCALLVCLVAGTLIWVVALLAFARLVVAR